MDNESNAEGAIRGVGSALVHGGSYACKLDTLTGWRTGAHRVEGRLDSWTALARQIVMGGVPRCHIVALQKSNTLILAPTMAIASYLNITYIVPGTNWQLIARRIELSDLIL